jgi:hypothetical protein
MRIHIKCIYNNSSQNLQIYSPDENQIKIPENDA